MTDTDPTTTARELAIAYGDAWNNHDVDAILDLQAPDTVFHLHLRGWEPTSTPEALRTQFEGLFAALPDYRAETVSLLVAPGHIVLNYVIIATLATPFPLGAEVGHPSGRTMRIEAVDIMRCADGRITRKDTYVDGVALREGLGL